MEVVSLDVAGASLAEVRVPRLRPLVDSHAARRNVPTRLCGGCVVVLYDRGPIGTYSVAVLVFFGEFGEDRRSVRDESIGVELDAAADSLSKLASEGMGIGKPALPYVVRRDELRFWVDAGPDPSVSRLGRIARANLPASLLDERPDLVAFDLLAVEAADLLA